MGAGVWRRAPDRTVLIMMGLAAAGLLAGARAASPPPPPGRQDPALDRLRESVRRVSRDGEHVRGQIQTARGLAQELRLEGIGRRLDRHGPGLERIRGVVALVERSVATSPPPSPSRIGELTRALDEATRQLQAIDMEVGRELDLLRQGQAIIREQVQVDRRLNRARESLPPETRARRQNLLTQAQEALNASRLAISDLRLADARRLIDRALRLTDQVLTEGKEGRRADSRVQALERDLRVLQSRVGAGASTRVLALLGGAGEDLARAKDALRIGNPRFADAALQSARRKILEARVASVAEVRRQAGTTTAQPGTPRTAARAPSPDDQLRDARRVVDRARRVVSPSGSLVGAGLLSEAERYLSQAASRLGRGDTGGASTDLALAQRLAQRAEVIARSR